MTKYSSLIDNRASWSELMSDQSITKIQSWLVSRALDQWWFDDVSLWWAESTWSHYSTRFIFISSRYYTLVCHRISPHAYRPHSSSEPWCALCANFFMLINIGPMLHYILAILTASEAVDEPGTFNTFRINWGTSPTPRLRQRKRDRVWAGHLAVIRSLEARLGVESLLLRCKRGLCRYAVSVCLSVCMSVCPSRSWILSKRIN